MKIVFGINWKYEYHTEQIVEFQKKNSISVQIYSYEVKVVLIKFSFEYYTEK